MYLMVGLSTLVWAVLFGTGLYVWWATSRPDAPHRPHTTHQHGTTHRHGRHFARPGRPRHRAG